MAKDYKHTKRKEGGLSAGGGFALGLGIGLLVAAAVHVVDVRNTKNAATSRSAPLMGERAKEGGDATPAPESAQDSAHYDFYDVLPKLEVVVPDKKKDGKKNGDTTGGSIDTPGTYVLQVGSWRNFADADRVRAKLALQGIESTIQKVSVDSDTWHRVRIGPITDLQKLENVRRRLREVQVDALVVRLGTK